MRNLATVAVFMVAAFGGIGGVAAGSDGPVPRTHAVAVTKSARARPSTRTPDAMTLVSVTLAALGGNVTSPRGPYRARPTKISFDLGG
jgi:hypothetical protein